MKHHTKRAPRDRSCADKAKLTKERAEALVIELARTQGALMSAYRCPFGDTLSDGSPAWHIGHSQERTLRRR